MKAKNVKVSVIIPVYNVEKYLRECLDSIVNQTLKEIEIICVDDGSADNSLKILQEYAAKDSRIILIVSKQNNGGGWARNQGLKIAQGEYLGFVDGDDFCATDFCEKMYTASKQRDLDIVICMANRFDTITGNTELMTYSLDRDMLPDKDIFNYKDMPEHIFNFSQNWNWNKFFKRSFVEQNNITFQEIHRTNDLLFTCKALMLAKRISTVQEALINYRINMENNCQSTNYKYPFDFYEAFLELRKWLCDQNLYDAVKSSYLAWAVGGCVYNIDSIKQPRIKSKLIKQIRTFGMDALDLKSYPKIPGYDKRLYNRLKRRLCPLYTFWRRIIS